ncbi:MAG: amidohydrolase family protein [Gemmataceae bacterium]|nr:amidohydrolase family protein [Gemmataceae bacterium]
MTGNNGQHSVTVFKNAHLIDGTGSPSLTGATVIVEGEKIKEVLANGGYHEANGSDVIDLEGRTLMPGMILAHVHLSYNHVKDLPDLDLKQPPEISTIAAVCNARTMLDCGFTAGLSAGALHMVDIHIRDAINCGSIPGPRLLAAGRDIVQTGGMLDWNPSWLKLGMAGLGVFVDGPWEVRKAVRQMVKDGADMIKMYITGEGLLLECQQTEVTCTQEEIDVMVEEAHRRKRLCSVHARSAESCQMAARAGVDLIDHATFIDDETIDLICEKKCYVAPGLDYIVSTLEYAEQGGFGWLGSYQNFLDKTHYKEELDAAIENVGKMKRRGVPILMGSDFGFSWCPHGTYARELTHYVKLAGFSPMEALVAATRGGAQAMRMADRIGTVQAGKLADLIVVDGNPLEDITILEDRRRITHVMKGGAFFRRPLTELVPAAV